MGQNQWFYRKSDPAGLLIRLKGSYGAEGRTDGRAALFSPKRSIVHAHAEIGEIKVTWPYFWQGYSLGILALRGGAWILDLMREMGSYTS